MSEEEEGQAMIRGVLLLLNMTGVPRLTYRLMLDGRVPLRLKLILPAALVYLISRIDIIPDSVPVIGRIDDVVVILVSLAVFLGLAPRDIVLEHLHCCLQHRQHLLLSEYNHKPVYMFLRHQALPTIQY